MARAIAGISIVTLSCMIWIATMTLAFGESLAELCEGPAPSPTDALDKAIMAYIDETRADADLPPLHHDDFSSVKMQQHACKTADSPDKWVNRDEYLDRVPLHPPLRRAIESEQYCHIGLWHFVRDGLVIGGVGLRKCRGIEL